MLAIAHIVLLALSLQTFPVRAFAITSPSELIATTTTIHPPTAPMTLHPSPTTGPAPEITPGPDPAAEPEDGDDAGAAAAAERFVQTTYWSCVKAPGVATAHCGWHEPILDASMPSAATRVWGGCGSVALVGAVAVSFLLLGI